MDIYDKLGVKKLINAWGTVTSVGGSKMPPEVMQSVIEASKAYVDIDELIQKAGQKIADLLGVEAAFISGGAGAGLAIASAACMAGEDPAKVAQLPDTAGMRDEVIVFKSHRNRYDQAVRLTGARFLEVGLVDRTLQEQIEAAVSDRTACLIYFAESEKVPGSLPLEEVVKIVHEHAIPVIVDAAAELPPVENFKAFLLRGADLVLFSGGKDLRGPQSTGLILGRKDLITACAANSCPHHSIGRPMKVDKEGIVGLYSAIEFYLNQDFKGEMDSWHSMIDNFIREIGDINGLNIKKGYISPPGIQPAIIPRAFVSVDETRLGIDKEWLYKELREGHPGIVTGVFDNGLVINPQMLENGEEAIIAQRIKEAIANHEAQ